MVVLAGCASAPDTPSRYSISQDRAPSNDFDISGLEDARPRYEAPRKAGNKSPYTVWGKKYWVMPSADGYVERGIASWYGEKFHGHKTSNGETFDMYTMSAAHKSFPLPGFARVTNLDNGRSVVVRVNDRGPFHGDRLIDLSYAAAKKLGYQSSGTARVEVAAITVRPDGSMMIAGAPYPNAEAPIAVSDQSMASGQALFVQLGSFSQRSPADGLSRQAKQQTERSVRVRRIDTADGAFHRVQVGPFVSAEEARREQQALASRGFGQAIVLTDTR
ncbi:septal ring lytic transglycosylase RlpA family protein [Marinobacter caseinilyticus]|uniref:septal ring lytic transglycosylase RlpA family protein n=1 Tax=Marinobacter caseinilyticus TaxID=2692195 RepID=UPI00140839F5|nr:septal ring lytic transglycosylase RlpA family protein [Marinobacter caseinilyticus]